MSLSTVILCVFFTISVFTSICSADSNVSAAAEEAVFNACSLRLRGISSGRFDRSKRDAVSQLESAVRLRIASFSTSNLLVTVFAVTEVTEDDQSLDVHFYVKKQSESATFIQPWLLNSWLTLHDSQQLEVVNTTVIVRPVDRCDWCGTSGCDAEQIEVMETGIYGAEISQLLIDHCIVGNRGVNSARRVRTDRSCHGNGELVRGSARITPRCECNAGFDGPSCQLVKRNFNGADVVVAEPVSWRDGMHLSIEFRFRRGVSDGVLLSVGHPARSAVHLMLYFRGAHAVLLLKEAATNGVREAMVSEAFSDLPHRLDLTLNSTHLLVIVDRCSGVTRKHTCTAELKLRNQIKRTELEPFLIGGLIGDGDKVANQRNFSGCILQVRVNGQITDLSNSLVPLKGRDIRCESTDCRNCSTRNAYCDIYRQCRCKVGYQKAPHCLEESTVFDFWNGGDAVWQINSLSRNIIRSDTVHLQLTFRTYAVSGHLFTLTGSGATKLSTHFITVLIDGSKLLVRYSLGLHSRLSSCSVFLNGTNVSDGLWHTAVLTRVERSVEISLDAGEANSYYYSNGEREDNFVKSWWDGNIVLGGSSAEVEGAFEGNIKDVRLRFDHLSEDFHILRSLQPSVSGPLTPLLSDQATDTNVDAHLVQVRNVSLEPNQQPDRCGQAQGNASFSACPSTFACRNLWRSFSCECPVGTTEVANVTQGEASVCAKQDSCYFKTDGFCLNGGRCEWSDAEEPQFACLCAANYVGQRCEMELANAAAISSLGLLLGDFVSSKNFVLACSLAIAVACVGVLSLVCMRKWETQRSIRHVDNLDVKRRMIEDAIYADLEDIPRESVGATDGFDVAAECFSQTARTDADVGTYAVSCSDVDADGWITDRDCSDFDVEFLRHELAYLRSIKQSGLGETKNEGENDETTATVSDATPDYASLAVHVPIVTATPSSRRKPSQAPPHIDSAYSTIRNETNSQARTLLTFPAGAAEQDELP